MGKFHGLNSPAPINKKINSPIEVLTGSVHN